MPNVYRRLIIRIFKSVITFDEVTLESLYNPKLWNNLVVLCKIKPAKDCVPVRSKYNGQIFNIGVNYFSSKEGFYYFLPDLIMSKLITGKTPKIIEAKVFSPRVYRKGYAQLIFLEHELIQTKIILLKSLLKKEQKLKQQNQTKLKD